MSHEDRGWLRNLPFSIDLDLGGIAIRLFHASSDSVHHRIFQTHSDDDFRSMFANTGETGDGQEPEVVVYGDIHDAYVKTAERRTLVNAGSVGNPLDEPTASYAILSARASVVSHQIVRVPYDIEREISVATRLGMPELEPYAIELRTSVYRGRQ